MDLRGGGREVFEKDGGSSVGGEGRVDAVRGYGYGQKGRGLMMMQVSCHARYAPLQRVLRDMAG